MVIAVLLQIPGGAATCAGIAVCVYIDKKVKNATCYLLAASCVPVIIGGIIIWQAPWSVPGVAVFGYTLIPIFGAPYVSAIDGGQLDCWNTPLIHIVAFRRLCC